MNLKKIKYKLSLFLKSEKKIQIIAQWALQTLFPEKLRNRILRFFSIETLTSFGKRKADIGSLLRERGSIPYLINKAAFLWIIYES